MPRLSQMVAALSMGRPKYEDHADLHAWANDTGRALADQFLALADDDAAAYADYAAAMKLPRDTDDEKAVRAEALKAAARHASEVPLAVRRGAASTWSRPPRRWPAAATSTRRATSTWPRSSARRPRTAPRRTCW